MTDHSQIRAVVGRYFSAINSDSFEELREVLSSTVELHMGASPVVRGIDDALDFYRAVLGPFVSHCDDPVRTLVDEQATCAIVEIDFVGEGRGGTSVRFTAVDIFEFDSRGFVGKLRSLYDTAGVAALMRADRAAASQGGV
jgi:hypothetical protein